MAGLADLRLVGAVPGLVWGDGGLLVDGGQFPCCAGKGARLSADGETTFVCGLSARLRAVRSAVGPYWREVPDAEAKPLEGELKRLPQAVVERLGQIAAGKAARGMAFTASLASGAGAEEAIPATPSVWAIAAASSWRFGLSAHVVVIGRTPLARVLPLPGAEPRVICVEHSDRPWDAPHADAFEMLVGHAYAAMLPLFVLLPPGGGQNLRTRGASRFGSRSLKTSMAERVGRARDRSPLSWLAPDAQAKLAEITDGLPSAKARQRPQGGVPLPWDL